MSKKTELKELRRLANLAEKRYIEAGAWLAQARTMESETRAEFLAARLALLRVETPEETDEVMAAMESATSSIESLSSDLKNLVTSTQAAGQGPVAANAKATEL